MSIVFTMLAGVGARAATVFETAGLMPASSEVVVVVHDGAALRNSPIGRSVVATMSAMAGFGETGRAWRQVSSALGMTPAEAFDALLGERMAFASRLDDGGVKRWVLVSEVRASMRERLVRSLQAAPRDVVEGSIVLSMENGAFAMVLADGPDGTSMLTIGPGRGDPMVLEAARSVQKGGAGALSTAPEMEELRQLGGVHANLLALVRDTAGADSWTGVVGVARGSKLDANFRVEMPALAELQNQGAEWSRASFEKLSAGALAAAVDISGPLDIAGPAADIILPLGLPPDMKAVMGSRVAMLVRPGTHGPLDFAVSVETTDTTAMAQAGDQWMDRLLAALPTGTGGHQLRADQFVAMPPTASRAVDLSRQMPSMRDSGWTAGPLVTWNTRVVLENCNPGQHHGWWTAGMGSGAVGALSTLVSKPVPDPIELPWVAMGVLRPADILRVVHGAGWEVPTALSPLANVREIRWDAMRGGSTELMGHLKVEVDEPADPAG